MAETKAQKQERLFSHYTRLYNAIPDFECFMSTISDEKDKKVFTENTFKNYFYKNYKGSKELIKAFKEGFFKKGDIVVSSLMASGNTIKGQRYGLPKVRVEVVQEFAKDWNIINGKSLLNKKLDITEIQDFYIDTRGAFGRIHFMMSNRYGNHVRKADAYLKQFVETATQRKTYQIR